MPIPKSADQHAAIARWLGFPLAYPHHPDNVSRIETHISDVFIAGNLVYKLKKPVTYDFLDFTTMAGRECACRDEVRLNRRLAPEVYLGVVPVTLEHDGQFCLNGRGDVVDWLVQMRRLPADKMLDVLCHRGELHPYQVDALAELLSRFYTDQPHVAITTVDYRSRILSHVHANLDALLEVSHHLPQPVVKRIHGFQLQLLNLQPEIFDERVQAERIIEGHGDLRPEHICFTDPIAIFDCIEFSKDFRQLDVADELAFLIAECDFIGAAWIGPRLLAHYKDISSDRPTRLLLDFYKAYRASVRAKVAALRADQLDGPEMQRAAKEAADHLSLADHYVSPHLRPFIIAVGGLSGTGKSTLAAHLADQYGAELLRSDVIRRELYGANVQPNSVDAGNYQQERRGKVYQEMFLRAAELHRQKISVVLDATFLAPEQLLAAHELVTDKNSLFLAIECCCTPELARKRIARRAEGDHNPSEARGEVYEHQLKHWSGWPSKVPQYRLDTEVVISKQLQHVTEELSQLLK